MAHDEFTRVLLQRLGARVRELRAQKNVSQRRAAADAGIHQSDWSRLERGQLDVRLSTLVRVQGALDADALLGRLPSRDVPNS
jgi:transcriptional regulator with XRE-family HTH domain